MIGIYKITSPTKRIYIGQSRDIIKRFKSYSKLHLSTSTQKRLWRSLNKYGVNSHIFEIIEECKFEQLNIRERYWQDFYDVLSPNGLNCILQKTDELPFVMTKEMRDSKSGENHPMWNKTHSVESKDKMRKSALGRKASKKTKDKLSEIRKGVNNSFYGRKHTEVSKEKQKLAKLGISRSDEVCKTLSESRKGIIFSKEHLENISKSKLGDKNPMFGKKGSSHHNSKPVEQLTLDNEFIKNWDNANQAAEVLKLSYKAINQCLTGKTLTSGGYKWKYKKQ